MKQTTFNIAVHTKTGETVHSMTGYTFDFWGFTFVVHHVHSTIDWKTKYWTVSELKTGLGVITDSQVQKDRKSAIEKATFVMERASKTKVSEVINKTPIINN